MRHLCLIAAVAVVFGLAVPSVTAGDFMEKKSGGFLGSPPGSGQTPPMLEDYDGSIIKVLAENYDKISYTLQAGGRGQKQEIDPGLIETIYYEPRSHFNEAAEAMGKGELEAAIDKFTKLANSDSERQWVRMNSFFNLALIYESMGQWEQAISAYSGLERALPRSRLTPEAIIQRGLAHMEMNDVGEAENAFKKLTRLPGLPEGQKGLGQYYMIYIKQRQGEGAKDKAMLQEALDDYRKLLTEVEGDAKMKDVATRCRLGVGNCLIALEKFTEAFDFFEEITRAAKDKGVLAGAFVGLGRCHMNSQEWKKAVLCFLRTELIYDAVPSLTAQALYWSGVCFDRMSGAGLGEGNATRARIQLRECIRRFGGSSWGQQADRYLPNIRGK